MTGPEHYREAERLAKLASDYDGLPNNHHIQAGQLSQAHATLALAAATALVMGDNGNTPLRAYDAWAEVAGEAREPAPATAGTGE
jgi:hypothetical protein